MEYFVIDPSGAKYGPANIQVLQQWVAEGRLQPNMMLEPTDGGPQVVASSIQGLFPNAPPIGGPYQPGSGNPYAAYQRPVGDLDDGSKDLRSAYICAAISIICCPPGFGIAAIIYASRAKAKNHPQGTTAMVVAIIAMVIGIGVSVLVRAAMS